MDESYQTNIAPRVLTPKEVRGLLEKVDRRLREAYLRREKEHRRHPEEPGLSSEARYLIMRT